MAERDVHPTVRGLAVVAQRAALGALQEAIDKLPDGSRGADGEPHGFAIMDLIEEMLPRVGYLQPTREDQADGGS